MDVVRPLYDDTNTPICPYCGEGFSDENKYDLHATHHVRGMERMFKCCLRSTINRDRAGTKSNHKCYEGTNLSPISLEARPRDSGAYENLYAEMEPLIESTSTLQEDHNWQAVYIAVRYSSAHKRRSYDDLVRAMKMAYLKVFEPKSHF